jgi:hypothetical protein
MKRRLNEDFGEVNPESSIDAQILAFFTKADRMAIKDEKLRSPLTTAGVEEALKRKKMSHLFEANEEEEDEESEEDDDKPKFNVETFASEIARLLGNPTALLNVEETIIKMAKNYVKNAYDDDTATKFKMIFDEQYDYSDGSATDNKPAQNLAVGAKSSLA